MARSSKIPITYMENQVKSHFVAILEDDHGLPHLAVLDLDQHIGVGRSHPKHFKALRQIKLTGVLPGLFCQVVFNGAASTSPNLPRISYYDSEVKVITRALPGGATGTPMVPRSILSLKPRLNRVDFQYQLQT